ncbi:type VII secretion integral membrane protein EccD [Nocardia sp. CDC159]|uniref:Type VII secretion integral membrane protein EccD n=1 Tax=Nocardia pulmonis TaxID=2951408 RepID=A0A9X2EDH4_9NOCA|nr:MULTISPECIES: type VII secretion integral membrane protein EccD [Nocardia]MCM6776101.1 type VII secretion integral membrane protein EccD [Nocardia pulmonis]MCM6788572.1 type VII secretion integral membrane protein EccD [Nocardia sp. CDC159]
MTTSAIGGRAAVEPELCRVSVIGGNTQLDIGLPASVPIASFIGELVELIESRNPDPTESDEDAAPLQSQHWTLARLGREPIPPHRTLTEAEVYDGELLVLRSVTAKESPALFDDVIDAVSRLTADSFRGWSPSAARWTGLLAGAAAVLVAMLLLAMSRSEGDGLVPPFLATGTGIAAMVAAAIAARKYADSLSGTWLSVSALLLLFTGAMLFAPGPLGSPHLLLGFSVLLAAAAVGYRATGVGATLFSLTITVSVFGAIAAAVRMIWDPALPKIAGGLLVGALVLISVVPRLSAGLARLPVPPVPTAGAAIDPADHEPRPTIEGIGAIGATALPSAVGLGRRAEAANRYQSGILAGSTVAAVVGALGAADPLGAPRWPGIALAVVTAIILSLRGRSFADLTQAGTLIVGGAVAFGGLLVGLALGDSRYAVLAAAVLLVLAAAVVFFGVVGPHIEITPVQRRAGEIFEYLLIVLVIPLVLWIMGIYSMARNL